MAKPPAKPKDDAAAKAAEEAPAERIACGLVMPISSIDGLPSEHWSQVRSFVAEVLAREGFEAQLVSNADDVSVIQRRIVRNLYDSPVVVVDVSGRNPNVMFELGLRLAFDKATVIIKDDQTPYSFDTSPIEHLEYPRTLRYPDMVAFGELLARKVRATYEASRVADYSPFLRPFSDLRPVGGLDVREGNGLEIILERLERIESITSRTARQPRLSDIVAAAERDVSNTPRGMFGAGKSHTLRGLLNSSTVNVMTKLSGPMLTLLIDRISALPGVTGVVHLRSADRALLNISFDDAITSGTAVAEAASALERDLSAGE